MKTVENNHRSAGKILLSVLLVVIILLAVGCGGGGASASASNVIGIQIDPVSATLAPGASMTFTATLSGTTSSAVTWSCVGGTIDQSGHYVAPTQQGYYTVTATSSLSPSAKSTSQITVAPSSGVTVTISPTSKTIGTGGQIQFSATVSGSTNTAVTWSATSGTIDQNGLYTAPSTVGSYKVVATSAANTHVTAIASVTVTTASIQILPGAPSIGTNETVQFSATVYNQTNQSVTWSASGGTITSTGLYQAPEVSGTYTVTATSVANPASFISVQVTVNPVTVSVAPSTITVVTSQPYQFKAVVAGPTNKSVVWTASGGSITSAGLFTAPATASTVTITATSNADPTKSGTATVTVVAPSTFFYNFSNGVPGVWTPTTNESTPSGIPFLGRISGTNSAQVVLDNLTTHTTVTVTFDLYVIGAWGGIPSASTMGVTIGGTSAFTQSFSNVLDVLQSYPLSGSNAPGTGATALNTLGYTSDPAILYNDATYHITCSAAHTASSITIVFTGNLTGTLANMAWGLKNVSITANP